ncbi:MAG TPA: zinc-binding alcohol dehydrogenase family protein [Actinoplanes sp.]|nr:zinc-binding alcohol dehydrogenase family protein [Actinoplanes sp.]
MMRAAVLHRCGEPPTVDERPRPAPGDDKRTVRVTAASITPLDVLCATGTSYFGAPATPYIPGVQGVGELDDGSAVWFATTAGMRPGDGSMAEYAVVRPVDLVPLPSGIDHRLMAALGLSAVAALMSLTSRGGLQPGEQVLVLGGGGVVGQAAIQLAKLRGARRVVAACRSEGARARAQQAGADAVVPLHDRDVPAVAADLTAAADGPVDLVIDPLFGVPAAAALRTLRSGGRLVNLGGSAGETAPIDSATVRGGSLSVLGYTNNSLSAGQRADAIGVIAGYARSGRLTLDFETVPLAGISEAWSRQSTGTADRRLVVVP